MCGVTYSGICRNSRVGAQVRHCGYIRATRIPYEATHLYVWRDLLRDLRKISSGGSSKALRLYKGNQNTFTNFIRVALVDNLKKSAALSLCTAN